MSYLFAIVLVFLGGLVTLGTQQVGELLTGRRKRREQTAAATARRLKAVERGQVELQDQQRATHQAVLFIATQLGMDPVEVQEAARHAS